MTSSHAGTPQARAKIHTTLTDFEIALPKVEKYGACGRVAVLRLRFAVAGHAPLEIGRAHV